MLKLSNFSKARSNYEYKLSFSSTYAVHLNISTLCIRLGYKSGIKKD